MLRIPVILAHGEGLATTILIALAAGATAVLCLIGAAISYAAQRRTGERFERKFLFGFIACVALIFLAPLIASLLGLP